MKTEHTLVDGEGLSLKGRLEIHAFKWLSSRFGLL